MQRAVVVVAHINACTVEALRLLLLVGVQRVLFSSRQSAQKVTARDIEEIFLLHPKDHIGLPLAQSLCTAMGYLNPMAAFTIAKDGASLVMGHRLSV